MNDSSFNDPWVSFCISTFRRQELLSKQISSLLSQTEKNFLIIISDNDPEGSAQAVADSYKDSRIKYYRNGENLGMIRSFNKSIDRATTNFIVMVTDDDPIDINFLSSVKPFISKYPGKSLYGGFGRVGKYDKEEDIIEPDQFIIEILDPNRTNYILWSGCVLKRADVLQIGKIPDFGSPHLADHAFLALIGSVNGAIMINTYYSNFTLHDANFSKFNFDYYTKGSIGFYNFLTRYISNKTNSPIIIPVIKRHIYKWFISNIFSLKKFYSLRGDRKSISDINRCSQEILSYPFMRAIRPKYFLKNAIFFIKEKTGMLR